MHSVFTRKGCVTGPQGWEEEDEVANAAREFAQRHGLKDGNVLAVRNTETGIAYEMEVFRGARGRYPWHVYDPRGSNSPFALGWGRTVALHRLPAPHIEWEFATGDEKEGYGDGDVARGSCGTEAATSLSPALHIAAVFGVCIACAYVLYGLSDANKF